jgi:hypothetical protein
MPAIDALHAARRPNGSHPLLVIQPIKACFIGATPPRTTRDPLDNTRASPPSVGMALERALTPLIHCPAISGHGTGTCTHSINTLSSAAPRRTLQDGHECFHQQRGGQEPHEPHRPASTGGDDTRRKLNAASALLPVPFSLLKSQRRQGDRWGFGASRPSSSVSFPFKNPLFGLMPDQSAVCRPLNVIFTRFTGFTRFSYLLNFRVHICKGGYGV